MQLSSPLKDSLIYSLIHVFSECFIDGFDRHSPIAQFPLKKDIHGYFDYINQRRSTLKYVSDQNPEKSSYQRAESERSALDLDLFLANVNVDQRNTSVDEKFRYLVKLLIEKNRIEERILIDEKISSIVIKKLEDPEEFIQTFSLINDLGLEDSISFAREMRQKYHMANAYAVNAKTTLKEDGIHFYDPHVIAFFCSIGLDQITINKKLLSGQAIVELRQLESWKRLREIYFSQKHRNEILSLCSVVSYARKNGLRKSFFSATKSEIAEVAAEVLSEIGFPHLSKIVIRSLANRIRRSQQRDEFNFDCSEINDLIKNFWGDMNGLLKRVNSY
jgi:hypothetical protein